LMARPWWREHEIITVDDLVPSPIVGHGDVIVIRQIHRR